MNVLANHGLKVLMLEFLDALDDVMSTPFESVDYRSSEGDELGPNMQKKLGISGD